MTIISVFLAIEENADIIAEEYDSYAATDSADLSLSVYLVEMYENLLVE